jgi:uncharacterized protein (DUF302 family)
MDRLDTHDITMASIVRDKVDPEMSIEDIEEAMAEVAIERNIKDVGQLPLSEQVELQLDKKQRFLKIYQYCKPTTAMVMVDHSDAFSAYLPCRIALIEDQKGEKWLYSLNMDMMIYGGAPLPPELLKLALEVKSTMTAIQKAGAGKENTAIFHLFGLQSKRCDKASKQRMHLNDQPLSLRLLVYSIGKS